MNVFIYTLSHPITNEIRYIGKCNSLKEREYNHIADVAKGKRTHKVNWIKSLLNQNLRPKIEILEEVSIEEWKYWEKYWINQFKVWGFNLVNSTSGGDGLTLGNQTSFKEGHKVWNKGLKGRKIKPDKNVHQYNAITGEYILSYDTAKEVELTLNIGEDSIANCARGISKTAGGFVWKYEWIEKIEPIIKFSNGGRKRKNN